MGIRHIVTDEEWDAKMGCGYKLLIIIFVVSMLLIISGIVYELTN